MASGILFSINMEAWLRIRADFISIVAAGISLARFLIFCIWFLLR